MSMVNVRSVRTAMRQRFLTTAGLPAIIQYSDNRLASGPPGDALWIRERFIPDTQEQIAFGVSEAIGALVYEVNAPASRSDLIQASYDLAHAILEKFEPGFRAVGSNSQEYIIIRSYTAQTGLRADLGDEIHVVPAIIRWRAFARLS